MDFSFDHIIRIPYQPLLQMLTSDEMRHWVQDNLHENVQMSIIKDEQNDTLAHQMIHWQITLNAKGRKLLRVPYLEIEDSRTLWLRDGRFDWSYHPSVASNLFYAQGGGQFHEIPQGTRRALFGEIVCKIPVVGRTFEKKACEWVESTSPEFARGLEEFFRQWSTASTEQVR